MQTPKGSLLGSSVKKYWLLVGVFLLLVTLGAKIDLDFGGKVSFTLQTLFLGIAYFYLPSKYSLVLVSSYLLLGILGVPVFNGGVGWSYFISHPLGFFIGFWAAAFLPVKRNATIGHIFQFFLVFHIIVLSFGVLWLWYYDSVSVASENAKTLSLGTIVKSIVGTGAVYSINFYKN